MNEKDTEATSNPNHDGSQKKHNEGMTESEAEEEREKKKKKQLEIDENPDLEDPRLYSPIQEPDRPDPSERTHEKDESKETCESSSHDEVDNTSS
jgi:hypothetical protein